MDWKHRFNAALARLGYNVVKLPRPWSQVQGRDWVADLQRLFAERPPRVIFDVGANIGQTARELTAAFPASRIYSFEPFPPTFRELEKNVSGLPNVTSVNMALGESAGQLEFHAQADSQTNSLLRPAAAAERWIPGEMVRTMATTTVPVLTLDEFCRRENPGEIDLLKLDTQGYEMHVLRGAAEMLRRGAVHAVSAEVQFVPFYEGQAEFPAVYAHLTGAGLSLVGFYNAAYSDRNRLLWADAVFAGPSLIGAAGARPA